MTASAYCVLGLMVIALVVTVLQWINGAPRKSFMWGCIVLYWALLTVKNLLDFIG